VCPGKQLKFAPKIKPRALYNSLTLAEYVKGYYNKISFIDRLVGWLVG